MRYLNLQLSRLAPRGGGDVAVPLWLATILLLVLALYLSSVAGCDIPGARDHGSFANMLHCTRRESGCKITVMTTILQAVDELRPVYNSSAKNRASSLTTCYYAVVDKASAVAILKANSIPQPSGALSPGKDLVIQASSLTHTTHTDKELYARCNLKVKGWTLLVVPDDQLPFRDPRRDSRVLKSFLHLFFPKAQFHIYMDGNLELLQHPVDIVSQQLFKTKDKEDSPSYWLAMGLHQTRFSIEEEAAKVGELNLDVHRVLSHQVDLYHFTNAQPMGPLFQGRFRIQANVPLIRAFECLWYNHISMHSRRDQLALVKTILDLELSPRSRWLPKKGIFLMRHHSHMQGRALNDTLVPSSRENLDPLSVNKPAERVFLDHKSPNALTSLWYFFKQARGHSMHLGWRSYVAAYPQSRLPELHLVPGQANATISSLADDGVDLRTLCSVRDLVVVRIYVDPISHRPAELLRRYVSDGSIQLIDLLIVEYSTHEPAALRTDAVNDFRVALREAVESWGILVMPNWNAQLTMGWDARTWELACRRNKQLRDLLPLPPAAVPCAAVPCDAVPCAEAQPDDDFEDIGSEERPSSELLQETTPEQSNGKLLKRFERHLTRMTVRSNLWPLMMLSFSGFILSLCCYAFVCKPVRRR